MSQRRSFSPANSKKNVRNDRLSISAFQPGKKVDKVTSDALYDILMKDPRKKDVILEILSQEKLNIKKHMREEAQVARQAACESPSALYRRKALEKMRQQTPSESSDVNSESSSAPSPVPFQELLAGVVAYVEVMTKGVEKSEGPKAMLRAMGAEVREEFTRDVTHVIFKEGSYKTFKKARLLKKHLLSLLWIEAVKTQGFRVPEKNFPAIGFGVYSGENSILCQKMQKEYEEALNDEYKRSLVSTVEPVTPKNCFANRRKTALPSELKSTKKTSSKSRYSTNFISTNSDIQSVSHVDSDSSCTSDRIIDETKSFTSNGSDCLIDGEITRKIINDLELNTESEERQSTVMKSVENLMTTTVSEDSSNSSISVLSSIKKHKDCRKSRDVSDMDLTDVVDTSLTNNGKRKSTKQERNTFGSNTTASLDLSELSPEKRRRITNKENLESSKGMSCVVRRKSSIKLNRSDSGVSSKNKNISSNDSISTSRPSKSSLSGKRRSKSVSKETPLQSVKRRSKSASEDTDMSSLRLSPNSETRSGGNRSKRSLENTNKSAVTTEEDAFNMSSLRISDNSVVNDRSSRRKSDSDKSSMMESDYSNKNKKTSERKSSDIQKVTGEGKTSKKRISPTKLVPVTPKQQKTSEENARNIRSSCRTRKTVKYIFDSSISSGNELDSSEEKEITAKKGKLNKSSKKTQRTPEQPPPEATKKKGRRKLYDPNAMEVEIHPQQERTRDTTPTRQNQPPKPLMFYTPVMVTRKAMAIVKQRKTQSAVKTKRTQSRINKPLPIVNEDPTTPEVTSTPARNTRRSTLEFMTASDNEKWMKKSPRKRRDFGIVCTRLHKPEVEVFMQIVKTMGKFVVEDEVSERTSHLVAGECKRTINLLKAIARGCWIVKHEWVFKSLEAGKWLPEEDFELVEFSPAVKKCRVERQAFGWDYSINIFQGCGLIYVARSSIPRCSDLEELIVLGKGKVTKAKNRCTICVGDKVEGATSVKELWILDSITQCKLKPFQPYLL